MRAAWGVWWAASLLWLCACEAAPSTRCQIEREGAQGAVTAVSGACPGKDFTGIDLSGADVSGLDWAGVTCPDGTTSAANGGTCAGHLRPRLDAGPDVIEPDDQGDEGVDPADPDPVDMNGIDASPRDMSAVDADFVDPMDLDLPPEEVTQDLPPEEEEFGEPVRRGCLAAGEQGCFDRCLWLGEEGAVEAISLPGLTLPWTWEAWVYLYALPAEGLAPLFSWGLPSDPRGRAPWALGFSRVSEGVGALTLEVGGEVSVHARARLRVGRWHHVVVDSTLRVFVDGEEAQGGFEGGAPSLARLPLNALFWLGHHWERAPLDGVVRGLRATRRLRYEAPFAPRVLLAEEEDTAYLWPLGDDSVLLREVVNMNDIPAFGAWSGCPR